MVDAKPYVIAAIDKTLPAVLPEDDVAAAEPMPATDQVVARGPRFKYSVVLLFGLALIIGIAWLARRGRAAKG